MIASVTWTSRVGRVTTYIQGIMSLRFVSGGSGKSLTLAKMRRFVMMMMMIRVDEPRPLRKLCLGAL